MTPPLFLLVPLPDASSFVLDGDEGRHAARVKRLGVGEALLVSDGRGTVLRCVVAAVQGDGLRLIVGSRTFEPAADPRLVVVQALPKGDRGELAVEMMTELGVDEIVPWAAARSITLWDKGARGTKALARWQRTAQEAAKQSRRAWVPQVAALASTASLLGRLDGALVLHEAADVPLASVDLPASGELALVVGPEGGVSDDELARFTAAGATAVRLGALVLRTSTAGPAALAALSVRLGRWT